MAQSHSLSPDTVLAVSDRLSDGRAPLLEAVAGTGAVAMVRAGRGLPEPGNFTAVIVDGPWTDPDPEWIDALRRAVTAGAALLVIGACPEGSADAWAELAPRAGGAVVPGEIFAKVADERHPLGIRVPGQFPVEDAFVPLRARDDTVTPVVVSVAFRDRDAVQVWGLGRGRVTGSGLGTTDTALANEELQRILRRAVRGWPGAAGRESGDRALGVGVVGYGPFGGMGYYHGTACLATAGLELVAVCDPSAERRKTAEQQFPGIRTYTAPEEMAEDDDLDLAVVATPPTLHAEVCTIFLEANKHVACEKPLCMTAADADSLAALARAHDVCLTINQNRRWDQDYVTLRRAVDDGLLGELFSVETFVGGFEHPCREWHSDTSVSGGTAYDWGSHHLDWILQLLGGTPAAVQTFGHKRVWHDVTNLDQIRVRLWWDDGREGEFIQSDVAAVRRPKFYVQGTQGTLVGHYRPLVFERVEPPHGFVSTTAHHAEAPAELVLARYRSGYGLTETRLPPAPPEPFAFHRNVADHLLLGEPLAVTPESVREVIAVLEAAQLSADQGGAVHAPR